MTKNLIGKAFAVALIGLCGLVIAISAIQFRADFLSWEAHYLRQSWERVGGLPPLDSVERAQSLYQRALEFRPGYPDYHLSLAYLYRLAVFHHHQDPETFERLARESLHHNRMAQLQRPTWSYSYSQAVVVKNYLGEHDAEWHEMFAMAWATGPWDDINLVQLAEAGIMRWPFIDATQRQITLTALVRANRFSRGNTSYLQEIAQTYGRLATLCTALADFDIVEAQGSALPRGFCP